MDPHCRIGKVRLKGNRSVVSRLPSKLIETSLKLKAELSARGAIREGRG